MSAMPASGSSNTSFTGSDRPMREDLEALRSDLNTIKADLRALAGDSVEFGRHAAADAKHRVGRMADQAKEHARGAYDAAKAKGADAAEAAERQISEHPFASVGIALAVGLAIGALISRR